MTFFDNEMLVQIAYFRFNMGEISCPIKYFKEAFLIKFRRSVKNGIYVIKNYFKFLFSKFKIFRYKSDCFIQGVVNKLSMQVG